MKLWRAAIEALRTALADLAGRPLAAGFAVLALALGLFLLAAFLVVSGGVRQALARLGDQAVIEAYLRDEADDASRAALAARVRERPEVLDVTVVDQAQALAEFRALYPDLGDIGALVGTNPFPRSLRIRPRGQGSAETSAAIEPIVALVRADPAVEAVRYDREWIAALAQLTAALGWLALSGGGLILLAALVMIAAVVRLALYDKRDEVALLRLVGAPASFVVAPPIVGGLMLGAIGGVVAVLAVTELRALAFGWAAATPLTSFVGLTLGPGLSSAQSAGLVLLGALAGAAAAALAAGRSVLR